MPEIIVGVDGSSRGEDAVAFAQKLARMTGARLVLASAYPYESLPGGAAGSEQRDSLRDDAESLLLQMRDQLESPDDVPVHAIADRAPARALQSLAQDAGAAMLVVGSSHRGHVGRILLGSTAERLLHGAPCPVAVVPRGYTTDSAFERIAVGYDGSQEGDAAVDAAYEVARRARASLQVVRVFDPATQARYGAMSATGSNKDWDFEGFAREDLERRVAALGDDVRAEAVFGVGAPGRILAGHCEGVDLMLLGSRGYGPYRAVLLGGVSHVVVGEASCPVVVLPRGARRGVLELFAEADAA